MADTNQNKWTHDCGHPLVPLSDEADADAACPNCHDLDAVTEPEAMDREKFEKNRAELRGDD